NTHVLDGRCTRTERRDTMAGESAGCPVQHGTKGSPEIPPAAGDGPPAQRAEGTGRWSSVSAWLPFRGGDNGASTGATKATSGGTSSSSSSGSGAGPSVTAAAAAMAQSTAARTAEHGAGGCPVNSSDDGGGATPSSSGCPVQHDSAASAAAPAAGALGKVWGYLTGSGGGSDGVSGPSPTAPGAAPPAAAAAAEYNAMNNEYVYGQEVAAGQEMPLSTSRQRSSIPKADFNPDHQPKKWVYPSEQQYYNAIKRKGYKASATDMPSTLAIHNAVNEKGWEMVQEWERAHAEATAAAAEGGREGERGEGGGGGGGGVPAPKLLRFTGRPKDTSPKAWVKSTLLGYRPPFDRHDWVVKRADGTEARYVIDFYAGKAPPGSSMPVAMHLDVRPALDSFDVRRRSGVSTW
ncbi:unnamed protein product, partial [Scytosiphon promiscuus]